MSDPPDRGPDDWGLPRPKHDPPHQRFFEDGEEPPERYDLPDRIDYIRPRAGAIPSARWWRLGWKYKLDPSGEAHHATTNYFAFGVLSLCCYLYPLYQALAATTLHAFITRAQMSLLTGGIRIERRAVYRKWLSLQLAHLPALVTRILALYALVMIGMALHDLFFTALERLGGEPFPDRITWSQFLPVVLGCALVIGLHTCTVVRVSGFVTHLMLDYDLGLIEAMRCNYRITAGRTGQLMGVKFKSWLLKYTVAILTCGFGLLVCEPFASAVWTAAYLDIAGSEPVREKAPQADGLG